MHKKFIINTHPQNIKEIAEQLAYLIDQYLSNNLTNESIVEAYVSIFLKYYSNWIYGNRKYYGFSWAVYQILLEGRCRALKAIIDRIEKGGGTNEI